MLFSGGMEIKKMTIWFGILGITVHSGKSGYIENLENRFDSYVDKQQGQIDIEIVETNFKPEVTKRGNEYFWFTMYSGNIYVYINNTTWVGKAFICEETPVRYDALDSMLTIIAAQFAPLFCSVLAHGCCLDIQGNGLCFMGDSGSGKSTIAKILSSENCLIAEDMFMFECYSDKIIGKSIPVGQKHFWVKNNTNIHIDNLLFIDNGKLGIEKEENKQEILKLLLHNQFYKARQDDHDLMDAVRFTLERILNNVNIYKFRWEACKFYEKDRKYISIVKNELSKLLINQEQRSNLIISDNISLNKFISVRKDKIKDRYEIWDTSSHKLYGLTGISIPIINILLSYDSIEYKKLITEVTPFAANDSINEVIDTFLKLNIIKKGSNNYV
jgi:hypothetical protein